MHKISPCGTLFNSSFLLPPQVLSYFGAVYDLSLVATQWCKGALVTCSDSNTALTFTATNPAKSARCISVGMNA